jgi:hypothetical protein
MGSGVRAPLIHNMGTRQRVMISFVFFYTLREGSPYPFVRKLSGAGIRPGRGGKQKHNFPCLEWKTDSSADHFTLLIGGHLILIRIWGKITAVIVLFIVT